MTCVLIKVRVKKEVTVHLKDLKVKKVEHLIVFFRAVIVNIKTNLKSKFG